MENRRPRPRSYHGGSTPRLDKTTPRADKNNASKEIKVGKDSGRVRVFVRFRPFSKDEQARHESMPYDISEKLSQLQVVADGHTEKTYTFDHVFAPNKTNDQVCLKMTQPLVKAAMNGFNGTLMAYGQTGTGKTYTLMSDTGITKSLIDKSFDQMQEDAKHNYKVTVSYLQIYQEKIFDLLTNSNTKGELMIRENPRTGIYVENLSEFVVRTPTEVMQFLAMGKKRLVFAETKMNRTSSRSHAVLQMCIERTLNEDATKQNDDEVSDSENSPTRSLDTSMDGDYSVDLNTFGKDVIIKGKIHICDLAGSERIKRTGAAGDRLSEAQHINSSLLELGNVIQALADDKTTHVPFRNSILTRLLQESLGGNCKTSLIVCVSPSIRDLQETKCTLNFGSRAMKVTNTAYVNMEVDFKSLSDQLLKQLQTKEDEIHKIKLACKEEVQRECANLQQQLEQTKKEAIEAENQLQLTHKEKLQAIQDELYLLSNEIEIKREEMKKLEDSIFIMDDELKREKRMTIQYLLSANEFRNKAKKTQPKNFIGNCGKILKDLSQHLSENSTQLTENFIIDSLKMFQDKIQTPMSELDHAPDKRASKELLTFLLKTFEIEQEVLTLEELPEQDLQVLRYKTFLSTIANELQIAQYVDELQEDIKKLEQNNCELTTRIEENKMIAYAAEKALKDEVDGKVQQIEVGVQVEEINTDTDKKKARRLVDTTVEDEEHVVTEIKTENVVENPDVKSSRDIFSGVSHYLGRIENMVASERRPKHDEIASRFGISSYLREDRLPTRSTSVLDYRPDDSLKFRTSSSLYKSFSGSTSRLHMIDFDSKYSSDRSTPHYTSSKSDFSQTKSGLGSSRNDIADSVFSSKSILSEKQPCLACGSINSKQPQSIEADKKTLEQKSEALSKEIEQLKRQNNDYVNLLENISRLYPNDSNLIKLKIRGKVTKNDHSTQTEDAVKRSREFNSVKVAHIKPLPSEGRSYSPSNTINVTYDLNENNVVQNIDSAQSSYTILTRDENAPSPNLNNFANRVRNDENKWAQRINSRSDSQENLMEFSPDTDDTKQGLSSYSSSIFNTLRESSKNSRRHKTTRDRPQTWYGFNENKEIPYVYRSHLDLSKSKEDLSKSDQQSKDLDLNSRNRSEEVIFSSNTRRSSWALPDWMKTKKNHSDAMTRQFIQ